MDPEEQQYRETVTRLREKIRADARALERFMIILVLQLIWTALRLAPWSIKAASVLGWMAGMAICTVAVYRLYALMADQVTAVCAAVAAASLAILVPIPFFLTHSEGDWKVWAGFASAALWSLGLAWGAGQAAEHAEWYAAINVAPVVLFSTLATALVVKGRRVHHSKKDVHMVAREGEL